MEVEPRIAKQYKCHHCCSCKNYLGKGMEGGEKVSLHRVQKFTSLVLLYDKTYNTFLFRGKPLKPIVYKQALLHASAISGHSVVEQQPAHSRNSYFTRHSNNTHRYTLKTYVSAGAFTQR